MAGMNKDANIARIIEALEVFISTISEIASVFFGEYDGGDFCSGLIFGKDGTVMMLKIAETFIGPPPPATATLFTALLGWAQAPRLPVRLRTSSPRGDLPLSS